MKLSRSAVAASIVLASGLALAGFFVAEGIKNSRKYLRHVEVKGLAERTVKSDAAVWTLSIKLSHNELPALYETIAEAQRKTREFLTKQGFKTDEMSMNPVVLTDNQSLSYNQNQEIPHYTAEMGLTVSTKAVDQVAFALQHTGELVQQGIVVTSSNALYHFTALNQIKPEMLEKAADSAREAAESFARHAKSKLGSILHATQGLFTITDANTQYDSGNAVMKKIRVVTTVDYQLKDGLLFH